MPFFVKRGLGENASEFDLAGSGGTVGLFSLSSLEFRAPDGDAGAAGSRSPEVSWMASPTWRKYTEPLRRYQGPRLLK